MRVVADTNIVVSGLLWHGAPRQVLNAARAGLIDLFTSTQLLAELEDVLSRSKFADRLARAAVSASELAIAFAALANIIEPAIIEPVIQDDIDDDAVLACAIAAQADAIVSGDSHLLTLKSHQRIPIETAAELLSRLPIE